LRRSGLPLGIVVADLERLRADTLQLLHESGELLEQIERINAFNGLSDESGG
jgi:hypothetical protein